MSQSLIDRSPDLRRLVAEGYELRIVNDRFLVVGAVPYLDASGALQRGSLVSDLVLAGEVAARPTDHVVRWIGGHPCDASGRELEAIRHPEGSRELDTGLTVDRCFSARPRDGFRDYHHKLTNYIGILGAPVEEKYPSATARTLAAPAFESTHTPFMYADTATSRAGIGVLSKKLAMGEVAIVGVGGTGSYVLDLLTKTEIARIHLFDGAQYLQHNAFRAPGAASIDSVDGSLSKVEYFSREYSRMHSGIVPHRYHIDPESLGELDSMSFVFLCVDTGSARAPIAAYLESRGIPFIDVGMGVEEVNGALRAVLRVTTSSPRLGVSSRPHRLPVTDSNVGDDYSRNIQVADLNMLNASLAVLRWKRFCGFYRDPIEEHFSAFIVGGNVLVNEDAP